jgi:hypothetical protein
MKNESLKTYKEIMGIVTRIINDWDPAHLLHHAPDDEYEFEIAEIVVFLNKAESVDNLTEGIALVFNKAFDWNLTKEECLAVAKNIWKETKGI